MAKRKIHQEDDDESGKIQGEDDNESGFVLISVEQGNQLSTVNYLIQFAHNQNIFGASKTCCQEINFTFRQLQATDEFSQKDVCTFHL